jgi:hypothetical protein
MKLWTTNPFATPVSRRRQLSVLALGVTAGLFASSSAWAQLGGAPLGSAGRASHPQSTPDKAPAPPPDAIPGAASREPVAPATHPAADMQPTDALFDAINRGDIAAARDALNRGADLNGVNILGMTPMELSVDLGRNDISFLLLSMRGEDSDRGSRALGRDAAPDLTTAAGGKTARGGKSAGSGKMAKAADIPVASKPAATPKLFANDGGTPIPAAGFLGFDQRSATN